MRSAPLKKLRRDTAVFRRQHPALHHLSEPRRGIQTPDRQIAIDIVAPMDWVISAQVLQEFYANAIRKRAGGISVEAANIMLRQFIARAEVAVDAALVTHAAQISQQHQISYWDAAIVAAAARSGAKELVTEDLNAGQVIEGITVVNPFI